MRIALETICTRVTTRCNLTCNHCWSCSPSPPLDLDPASLVAFLDSLKALGLRHVSVSGGEPTLYPQATLLIRQLLERGYDLSVTTNGTLPEDLADLLSTVSPAAASRLNIRVSVDGWKSLHEEIRGKGTFDATMASIAEVAAVIGHVSLNTVVFTNPIRVADLVRALPTKSVHDWALLTPVERTPASKSICVIDDILNNIDLWRRELSELLPSTRVRVWDYLRHPNGGFVVEADGLLTMPGVHRDKDVIVGNIETTTPEIVQAHITRRLNADPIAFFLLDT